MENPKIRIRLVGIDDDAGSVRLDDFRKFLNKLSECLHRTETAIKSPAIQFLVTDLKKSSAGATMEALAPEADDEDHRAEVVDLFFTTVTNIQIGAPIDGRFSSRDLKVYRELIASPKRIKEFWVDERVLTQQYVRNIDKILGTKIKSRGSIAGRLEKLNVHNKNEFILYPPIAGEEILCRFPQRLFEEVRLAVKQHVTVNGILHYLPDKALPDWVRVQSLEIHPPDDELPTLMELRGIFKGGTDGLSAVDFVRKIRDEQEA